MIVVLPDFERDTLAVLQERKRLEAQVKAFEQALKVLEAEIKKAFPDSAVQLSLVGDQVVVRGESKDVIEAAQILRIVAQHTPTARRSKVEPRSVNVAFIPGLGDEQAAVAAIREILEGSPNMVNLLRVPGEQQVMLMVTVAEVNRNAARSIGVNFDVKAGAAEVGQFTGGLLTALASHGTSANLPISLDNGQLFIAIQALRTLSLARSLAEPNLTTLNGKPANFLAGGSFPIPTSVVTPGGAAQSVSYQNFGVSLQFVPYITDRDRIRLQLNASVSTPSTAQTQVSGASVPSQITQRNFSTTVELREGQTLSVAGLIQNNMSTSSNRVPFWGDLPIIGRTGGLDNVTSQEQEIVILVTPLLVHPLDMCKTPPLPGNDVFEPGDVEFYLLGHLEGRRTQDYRASVRSDYCRQKRFCDCNNVFIIGPHGSTYGCCQSGCGPLCTVAAAGTGQSAAPAGCRAHPRSRSTTRTLAEDRTHAPRKRIHGRGKRGQSPFAGTNLRSVPALRLRTNGDCPLFPVDRGVVAGAVGDGAGRLLPRRTEALQRHHSRRHTAAQRDVRLPVDSWADGPRRSRQLRDLPV